MITQQQLYAMSEAQPEIKDAFYKVVSAIIDYRNELAAPSGLFASMRRKKKQFAATFLCKEFSGGFIMDGGRKLSEEERQLVEHWLVEAANFHSLPKDQQELALRAQIDAQGAS
ncbi:hypothetical protein [Bradyrhizobium genosp. P]|uniref:hypothetical protein n=1 Tax=Bradyrhizobium genosp. P TaxID=83641 RepID=UPI003CEF9DAB